MKANALTKFGVPEEIEEQEIPIPIIKNTQVLVEMYASSINPADFQLRSGLFLENPMMAETFSIQLPLFLGVDVAGIVKEVGTEVSPLKPGDRVMVTVPMASYMY